MQLFLSWFSLYHRALVLLKVMVISTLYTPQEMKSADCSSASAKWKWKGESTGKQFNNFEELIRSILNSHPYWWLSFYFTLLFTFLPFILFFLPLLPVLQFYGCFISDIKTIITPNRSYLYIVSIILFFFSFLFYFQQFVVIASLTSSDLSYDNYVFPEWANQIGWGVALSSMLMVPSYAMYKFCSLSGTFREVCIKICSAHNV